MPSKRLYGFLLVLILSLFCLHLSLGQEDNSGALSLKLVYNGNEVDTSGIKQLFSDGKDDLKLISTVPSVIKNQIPNDLKSAMETETLGDLKKEILPIKESKTLNEAKEKWEKEAPKTIEVVNKTINWVYSTIEKIKNLLDKQDKDFVEQVKLKFKLNLKILQL
ncbi:unnamed protein product [Meloidogyne enterolobii]|uniref:Uncharacterized protein n=3 Tax=Meloidogyne enterolobii TaxID=390850 RepID=A0ACB0XMF4_MELEN|nr:unnamed protein product [Meloidogyne enterolobii]